MNHRKSLRMAVLLAAASTLLAKDPPPSGYGECLAPARASTSSIDVARLVVNTEGTAAAYSIPVTANAVINGQGSQWVQWEACACKRALDNQTTMADLLADANIQWKQNKANALPDWELRHGKIPLAHIYRPLEDQPYFVVIYQNGEGFMDSRWASLQDAKDRAAQVVAFNQFVSRVMGR